MTTKLDKSKPHGTVHGVQGEPGEATPAFEQDGRFFDVHGNDLGASGAKEAAAEKAAKDGHGNIAHGAFDERLRPLEEGGGGGGMTKSWPEETAEAKAIREADEAVAASKSTSKKK